MNRSAWVRFVAFLGVLAVLVGYVAYHKVPSPATALPSAPSATHVATAAEANYIANLKQHRDSLLSAEIATLKAVIANQSVSQAARRQAETQLAQDQTAWQDDMKIEGLLQNQGIAEAVALVGANSVQIVVGMPQLSPDQVGRIADTVTAVTGIPPENIVIIPHTSSS